MKKGFASVHARAFCHATEDPRKVALAMQNVLGDVALDTRRTEGVHGNPITVFEATLESADDIAAFFCMLDGADIEELLRTLDSRMDEGCNMFLRLDKQQAFLGRATMARGDDVISVRAKVLAFPARCEVAKRIVAEFLEGVRRS